MKTTLTKIALLGIAGAIAFALSSFKASVSTTQVNVNKIPVEDEYAEWNKVRAFVDLNITTAVKQKSGVKVKANSFSRCPSGYHPEFLADYEEVKTDREVLGSLVLYKGCEPDHILDFKVFVNKKIALVKNKDAEEYMTVKEWLAKKDAAANTATVKNTKTVKG